MSISTNDLKIANDPYWWCGTFKPNIIEGKKIKTINIEDFKKGTEKTSDNKISKTFEEKAEIYAKGEIEIQKLIKNAEIQKHQKKGGKWWWCGTFAEPLSKEEIAKIRNDYEKTHPAYASVRKECEDIKKRHDKTIETLMRRYDIANIDSEEDKELKTAKRNVYKKEIEKQYKKDNPDYDLLVKTEKYFDEHQEGVIVFKSRVFDETDIMNTVSTDDLNKLKEGTILY